MNNENRKLSKAKWLPRQYPGWSNEGITRLKLSDPARQCARWSDQESEDLAKFYLRGLSVEALAEKHQRKERSIKQHLARVMDRINGESTMKFGYPDVFIGIIEPRITGPNGTREGPNYKLYISRDKAEGFNWRDSMAIAKERGGDLPSMRELVFIAGSMHDSFLPMDKYMCWSREMDVDGVAKCYKQGRSGWQITESKIPCAIIVRRVLINKEA